jgi:integrase
MKTKLPNGCACSELKVTPSNWYTKSAKTTVDWYISYRFYDPNLASTKQVKVRRMNTFKVLQERQKETQKLLREELEKLQAGFNPTNNLEQKAKPQADEKTGLDDAQELLFVAGLKYALSSVVVSTRTKKDLGYTFELAKKAIPKLGLDQIPISQISRKHIRNLLKRISNTSDRFNKNRSYLMILFSELSEDEIVDVNPVRDIRKKKVVKRIRTVLTDQQRVKVNDYLLENHPYFYRFLHIFFHSGCRISELMKVREQDVDIANQRFKITIQKGKEYREVWKVIKDIVLPIWNQVVLECNEGDYLFSRELRPGSNAIQSYQIGKRWNRHVKKKLNIAADFYSIKHLHTTEVVDLLSDIEAAKHNDHRSTAMVNRVYDVKRKDRTTGKVKTLNNPF